MPQASQARYPAHDKSQGGGSDVSLESQNGSRYPAYSDPKRAPRIAETLSSSSLAGTDYHQSTGSSSSKKGKAHGGGYVPKSSR